MSPKSNCAFCKGSKPLQDSHIIPRGIWRLKDSSTGFLEASSESSLPPKKLPKGWYEKLLCDDCEKFFGREFDDYGRNFFASEPNWQVITLGPVGAQHSFSEVIDFDYSKLKLFLLSVLWRASVAKATIVREFNLLPEQEERLSEMLKALDSGDKFDFGTAIFKYFDDGKNLHKIMLAPRLFNASGSVRYAELQFNEFVCRINVSNLKDIARYEQAWLDPSGSLRIVHVSPQRKISVGAKIVQEQNTRYKKFRESRQK
jgi:hypothetical protein